MSLIRIPPIYVTARDVCLILTWGPLGPPSRFCFDSHLRDTPGPPDFGLAILEDYPGEFLGRRQELQYEIRSEGLQSDLVSGTLLCSQHV